MVLWLISTTLARVTPLSPSAGRKRLPMPPRYEELSTVQFTDVTHDDHKCTVFIGPLNAFHGAFLVPPFLGPAKCSEEVPLTLGWKTRIVLADDKIHILGFYQTIAIARRALCNLILGSPPSKVYGTLRTVAARTFERFWKLEIVTFEIHAGRSLLHDLLMPSGL